MLSNRLHPAQRAARSVTPGLQTSAKGPCVYSLSISLCFHSQRMQAVRSQLARSARNSILAHHSHATSASRLVSVRRHLSSSAMSSSSSDITLYTFGEGTPQPHRGLTAQRSLL